MSAILPLMRCWTISAPSLPEELLPAAQARGFSLPGADDLTAFADLLGAAQEETPDQESSAQSSQNDASAPFDLPALAPDALSGPFSLSCSVDFGALHGDHAVLAIDHICWFCRFAAFDLFSDKLPECGVCKHPEEQKERERRT